MSAAALNPQQREAFSKDPKNLVPEESVQVKTAPVKITIGIREEDMAIPRPDLSGLRVTSLQPGNPIYMVDPEGFLRKIPNPETYNNLFVNWSGIIQMDLIDIAIGTPITDGAILAKRNIDGSVYIVSNGMERPILSPEVMNKYNFNWAAIYLVPHVLLDFIRTGNTWY